MKTYIFIIFLLSFKAINAQSTIEQTAFDYFFDYIIENEYENPKIKFSGNTEPAITGTLLDFECINKEDLIYLYKEGFKESVSIGIKNKKYIKKNCIKGKRKKLYLKIYRSLKFEDYNLILIKITEKKRNSTNFYIKINQNSEVIDWCKTVFII